MCRALRLPRSLALDGQVLVAAGVRLPGRSWLSVCDSAGIGVLQLITCAYFCLLFFLSFVCLYCYNFIVFAPIKRQGIGRPYIMPHNHH